jgi:hypothetical protein
MIIQRLQQKYDSAVKDTVSAIIMCSTLAVALNDPQNAMRQMAVSTLAGLYPIYGEELVVSPNTPADYGVRPISSFAYTFRMHWDNARCVLPNRSCSWRPSMRSA